MIFSSRCRRAGVRLLYAVGVALSASPALADGNIGVASHVQNYVNGILPSRTIQINAGEGVTSNEIVKTNADSQAKIVFTDSTNLSVGPNSTVKLDKFVAAGPSTYEKATINLAKGAFRFVTGHSDKRAYEIKTEVATIGVRGTIVEGYSRPGKVRVDLREGLARICTIPKPGQSSGCRKCVDLSEGQSAEFGACSVAYTAQPNSSFTGPFASAEPFEAVVQGQLPVPPEPPVGMGALFALGTLGVIGGGIGIGAGLHSNFNGQNYSTVFPTSP
jgi:ferric-dicitrate binding protein FerR (iron transport regulator)